VTAPFFVTGTGTGVGKTWVARGITAAAIARGLRVAALKPYETGVDHEAADAAALARAARRADLAEAGAFYRVAPPLAPWAATLSGETPPPTLADLAAEVDARSASAAITVVEGAGGLLVPVDEKHDVADLAMLLGARLILVTRDGLGVLSYTLTAAESAARRELPIAAVVLTPPEAPDPSTRRNQAILEARLPAPVIAFPPCPDDDRALAAAAEDSGLMNALLA